MEEETRPSEETAGASGGHPKPMLTVGQQIAHMKAKGITFGLVSEEEAARHLRAKCQFFRIYAYRKLFEKRIGGERDGQYVGLDFGHLKVLSNLDRKLRDALLPMALDLEHFAKVRLLAAAEDNGEDGYAVMRDYMASVTDRQRSHLEGELDRREDDPYAGDVVRKYRGDMPLWAFCEVVSFGAFLGVLRFCADRWGDRGALGPPLPPQVGKVDPQRFRARLMRSQRPLRAPVAPLASARRRHEGARLVRRPEALARKAAREPAHGPDVHAAVPLRPDRPRGHRAHRPRARAGRPVRLPSRRGRLPPEREPGSFLAHLRRALDTRPRSDRLTRIQQNLLGGFYGAGVRKRFCPGFHLPQKSPRAL